MMRTAILSALLAVVSCLLCAPAPVAHAQAQPASQAAPQSVKATIPVGNPGGAPGKAVPETDPSKLAAPVQSAPKSVVSEKTYIIGPEDVIRVQVWGEQRLSGDFVVRPDGRLSMNLINEIEAAGKTPEELGIVIADRLKAGDFMKAPSVNIAVVQVNSKKYYINGEVLKPGSYSLAVPVRVLEALTNAGGFKDFANQKKIRILRQTKDGWKEFRFNYKNVSHGKDLDQNIYLEPGDQIIVP